ncbi:MAG TPA: class I SAM-dependent methyltransferase [Nannocystis sp.]|jgi:ubiquinone/menaquinone biosynthesis C-methylase UbiE
MRWYDWFASFYDRSLEPLYRDARAAAVTALAAEPGQTVLDLPCGTGQSFDGLAAAVGPGGRIIGVDLSEGMLRVAEARARRGGHRQIALRQRDVHLLDAIDLAPAGRDFQLDRLHIFLGLTAFPRWEAAFERLWGLLAPGGRCVIVDVHAAQLGLQGRLVNLIARADLRREVWRPLERRADNYEYAELTRVHAHGGQIFVASGDKPR